MHLESRNEYVHNFLQFIKDYQNIIIQLIILYSLVISSAYWKGYYSLYNINIFQYVSFSQIIINAFYIIFPILIILYLEIIILNKFSLIIDLWIFTFSKSIRDRVKFKQPIKINFGFIYSVLTIILLMYMLYLLYFIATLIAMIVAFIIIPLILRNYPTFIQLNIFVLFISIFLSYDAGKLLSNKIYLNNEYSYMEFLINNKIQKVKLLGYANNKYIFSSLNNEIIYITSKDDMIVLKYFKK